MTTAALGFEALGRADFLRKMEEGLQGDGILDVHNDEVRKDHVPKFDYYCTQNVRSNALVSTEVTLVLTSENAS